MANQPIPVILASGSAARATLLRNAGVTVEIRPTPIDEASIKASFAAEGADVVDCAMILAEMKAVRISRKYPGCLVIGGDQILDLDGRWFDKPETMDEARVHLRALRGKTHRLISSGVVVLNGARIWGGHDVAELTMRNFTDGFLDGYLNEAGSAILSSVGAYHLEGLGVQLFEKIRGDYFTILGLPLFALLEFLRGYGVVAR